jgi:rsbT co-antagonist protein RsbR
MRYLPLRMSDHARIRLNSVDIEWDLRRGDLSFFGLDSVLMWTNPSMYRLLCPLVDELGVELFRLLVAHGSSLGTDIDYDVMVNTLGRDFVSGFLAWGDAVAAAGWGRFEVLAFEPDSGTAKVRVHHPWELRMQFGSKLRWGCPFVQGKIIGLFSHAFHRSCWADETLHEEDPKRLYVDLKIYPSHRRLDAELEVLRRARLVAREGELLERIDHATAELRSKLELIDRQRELIARLTYPILEVWDGVLVAVLIGDLHATAMADLTEALLDRVQSTRARAVVLDCTGVQTLGAHQTGAVDRIVAALRLLGAQPLLVGLSAAAAAALASEPGALQGVPTLRSLADALQRVMSDARQVPR